MRADSSSSQLGLMGFLEVLKHVPGHFLLLPDQEDLDRGEIALLVLIDYPGFNRSSRSREAAGVPVLYT